jgi:hypothetical protein
MSSTIYGSYDDDDDNNNNNKYGHSGKKHASLEETSRVSNAIPNTFSITILHDEYQMMRFDPASSYTV